MPLPEHKLIMFDLDGTLAPSKSPLERDMAEILPQLIAKKKVLVISGGSFAQFQTQFLHSLPHESANYSNLYLMPTSGTRLYTWKGDWHLEYAENLTSSEKEKILVSLREALKMTGYDNVGNIYGEQIEDRDSQITFSALGQKAPLLVKEKWDPDRKKRQKVVDILSKKIPDFDIRIGGSNSIDITKKGVNKGYGIRKIEQFLNITHHDILFIGDALYHGGNDYPAKAAGVDTIQVSGPEETKKLIASWLS